MDLLIQDKDPITILIESEGLVRQSFLVVGVSFDCPFPFSENIIFKR